MNLSAHLTLDEFTASGTAEAHHIDNSLPKELLNNAKRTSQEFEEIRSLLGNQPLRLASGYRSYDINKLVGGVPDSYHTQALAFDFHPPEGMSFDEAQRMILDDLDIHTDKLIVERTKDGLHEWLHFQTNKDGTEPRRLGLTAEVDHLGGSITRISAS